MAFVKLDTGILNSTLWVERECREVFITALLMAMPREFTEPQPQIEVRTLNPTGFVAPAGWYGFVEAAGIGIVRRAMVDHEAGMSALERLGSEDPESRSKEYGGRRLIRVNGGYLVLNFLKYRDKDHTAAERARRYRDRKAAASRRDISASHRDITQAEAEAYTEAEKRKTKTAATVNAAGSPGASPGNPTPPPDFDGLNAEVLNGKAVVPIAAKFTLPEPWGVDAEALGFKPGEVMREGEKFRQYWTEGGGKGKRRSVKGWRQSWSNWLEKAAKDKR